MSSEGVVGPHLPSRLLFDQRQQVGCVAIDFVCTGKYKSRIWAMPASGFKQVERAVGVDTEIGLRVARCPVMGGLGSGMNNRTNRASFPAEYRFQQVRVANVAVNVLVFLHLGLQSLPTPCSTCVIAEQDAPHVIVDADNIEAFGGEKPDGFSSDQPGRTRHQYDAHIYCFRAHASKSSSSARCRLSSLQH